VILREPANALDPRMRAYWTVESLFAALVAAVVTAVVATITALADATTAAWIVAVVGGLVVLAAAVSAFVTPRLDYRHYRYEVTDLGLYVARGWLWRRWQIVPHARVQTVDTTAGPLLRAFGLVAVAVTTASAVGGTSIPGLLPGVADALVEELARRAGIEEGT
jgi:membrane protein YdbS with pleckstrin-like domain